MIRRFAEPLLIMSIVLRASSLLFTKIALESMGPILLIGARMLVAFVIIGLLFHKELRKTTRKEVLWGFIVGLLLFASMAFEHVGLKTTSSSTTSFLENAVVLVVPLMTAIIYRRLPQKNMVISAIIAVIGILCLSLKGTSFSFTKGELLIMISTFIYALFFITTDYAVKRYNALCISIFELLFVGVFALITASFTETVRLPNTPVEFIAILWLAIVCSGFGFTLQPVAQEYVDIDRAGLMNAFYPVTAAVLGVLFLHEHIALNSLVGCALVIIGIAYPFIEKKIMRKRSENAMEEVEIE